MKCRKEKTNLKKVPFLFLKIVLSELPYVMYFICAHDYYDNNSKKT